MLRPMAEPLRTRFADLCERIAPGASSEGAGLAYLILESLYANEGPGPRAYHTLRHVAECLALFDEHRGLAEHPDAVEFAIYAHDAVYDATRKDNEARSAAVAAMLLDNLKGPSAFADRVSRLIGATTHSRAGADADEKLLIDVDLSILGAAGPRYDEYAVGVRKEFAHADGALYRAGRRAFLRSMLARAAIYTLAEFRERFEGRARANMELELRTLEPGEAEG